jgi:hypothetical protein
MANSKTAAGVPLVMHNYNNVAGFRHFHGMRSSKAARFPDEFSGMRKAAARAAVGPLINLKLRQKHSVSCWCE